MNVKDLLKKEHIAMSFEVVDKTEAITRLVDLLNANGQLDDRDAVLDAVLAREATRSTGIGNGLAVPHGKSSGCHQLTMAVGKPATPLEFGSIDSKPCGFIILLVSPVDKTGPHIQTLASISRLWLTEGFRLAIAEANTPEAILEAVQKFSA